jgi:hypothetical protein
MPRFLTLVVGVAAVVIGGAAQVRRADDRPFIAFRDDAERVVIDVADEARLPPPDPEQPRGLPPGALALAAPIAAYPGPHVAGFAPPARVSDRPGDRWTVLGVTDGDGDGRAEILVAPRRRRPQHHGLRVDGRDARADRRVIPLGLLTAERSVANDPSRTTGLRA